jgi:hypothetical protein
MPIEVTGGQSTLFIRRDAFERARLTRAALDERLNLTAEEFRVEGGIIVVGPLPNDDELQEMLDELEETGLAYFDDYFELSGNWPQWLKLFAGGT